MSVVTKSLGHCATDLVHFLLVFLSVVLTYCIIAVLSFGRSEVDYVTIWRTIQTVFLQVLGIFDWEEMAVVGRVEAGVYFWTFMVISNMLLLNMLLAMVMEAYSHVKITTGRARPIWAE